MKIREVMTQKVARVGENATMQLAAELLALTKANDLVVIGDDGKFVGVLSEGDLLRNLMPDLGQVVEAGGSMQDAFQRFAENGKSFLDKPIGDLVIRNPFVVSPDDDLLVAANVMDAKKIRRLPVVDHGKFVGSISRADIIWALLCRDAAPV